MLGVIQLYLARPVIQTQMSSKLRKRETYDLDTGVLLDTRLFNQESEEFKSGPDAPAVRIDRGKTSDATVRQQGAVGGTAKASNAAKAKAKPLFRKSHLLQSKQ